MTKETSSRFIRGLTGFCLATAVATSGMSASFSAFAAPAAVPATVAAGAQATSANPFENCSRLASEDAYSDKSFRFLRPGKGEWLFRDSTDFSIFPLSGAAVDQFSLLAKKLQKNGIKLVMVVPPQRGALMGAYLNSNVAREKHFSPEIALANYNENIAKLRRAGIVMPDIVGQYRSQSNTFEKGWEFYLPADLHWSPEGAFVSASAVAAAVGHDASYEALPVSEFKTTHGRDKEYSQAYRKEAARICGVPYVREIRPSFVTAQLGGNNSGLLGDTEVGIALIGTSFSALDGPNFAGFLRETLHRDVANYAISGGGFEAAFLSYLMSEDFQQSKPKYIVWETQTYNLKETNFLPLIIGAVDGDCGSSAIFESKTESLKLGRTQFMSTTASERAKIRGKVNIVVDIKSADPRLYQLNIDYVDGQHDKFIMDASRWSHSANKLVVRLNRDGSDVASMSLIPSQRLSGAVSARVCRAQT
ncbi:MAG: hypothetical protein JF615_01090 [Asticcacaulis sp.]|nr:hypothetical protein [Asticcacaulis sp.]